MYYRGIKIVFFEQNNNITYIFIIKYFKLQKYHMNVG